MQRKRYYFKKKIKTIIFKGQNRGEKKFFF